jgi:hypothetical protein
MEKISFGVNKNTILPEMCVLYLSKCRFQGIFHGLDLDGPYVRAGLPAFVLTA